MALVHLDEILPEHPSLMVYTGFATQTLPRFVNVGFATNALVHAIYLQVAIDSFAKNCLSVLSVNPLQECLWMSQR